MSGYGGYDYDEDERSGAAEDDHAAQLWRELVESSVECELCNEPYAERDAHLPRLLSCGHTFCQSCLEDWSATAISTSLEAAPSDPLTGLALASMECPTCRRVTTFNAVEGPRALPKNFELLRVRQEMESQTQHRLQQLKQAWTTQVLQKEQLAREAEENAMVAQRESVQASQRAMFLAKQVAINEQEKKQAQEIAEEARRRALAMSQQAEALQAETEQLKQRLQQEALQLQRVKRDASSKAAEAAELHSKAEQLKQQVECVRAQLSLHAGRHDPSKLVVLVVEPTTVGSWLMPYTRYAVISIARSDDAGAALDPYHAAKTWIKMRHAAEPSSSVKVYRRYSDFVWLHHELHRRFPYEFVPSIPAKQLFFLNKDKEFVGERMRSLQAFLREILRHPVLATTEHVRAFLLSTTEELENLRNASRMNDDDDDSFLKEVEANEASAVSNGRTSRSGSSTSVGAGAPPPSSNGNTVAAPPSSSSSRSSWAWGAVSAITSGAAKLVTSTGSALTSSIAGVSTSAAPSSTEDVTEKSISSSLTILDEETDRLSTAARRAIEKRRRFIEIAKAHQSVTQKGAHLSRVQRKYAHHLHRLCELMHGMDTLDSNYAKHKRERHLLAVSMMDHSSTYTARQVEEDARACLESERPFQEKASEVFSSLSLATSSDAECMEYALLEISRMQTLHLGAIEDAFSRLRTKEDKLQKHAMTSGNGLSGRTSSYSSLIGTPSAGRSSQDGGYGSGFGSPPMLTSSASSSSSLFLQKQEELQSRRHELVDKVARVDPARAKFVLETLQQNAKEMHTLAVAKRKLHEASYAQLLAACRAV